MIDEEGKTREAFAGFCRLPPWGKLARRGSDEPERKFRNGGKRPGQGVARSENPKTGLRCLGKMA